MKKWITVGCGLLLVVCVLLGIAGFFVNSNGEFQRGIQQGMQDARDITGQ